MFIRKCECIKINSRIALIEYDSTFCLSCFDCDLQSISAPNIETAIKFWNYQERKKVSFIKGDFKKWMTTGIDNTYVSSKKFEEIEDNNRICYDIKMILIKEGNLGQSD